SVNQRPARLLDRHGDGATAETLPQLGHPGGESLGFLFKRSAFGLALAGGLQTEGVLLIGPVDADKGREVLMRVDVCVHSVSKNTLAGPSEGLIVRPAYRSGPPL